MASFCLLLFSAMFMALIACNSSLASSASLQNMHVSTPPTMLLPGSPLASPTLSPDIEPLFPTPGRAAFSPSESSLPTIPSTPSPPNSDGNLRSIAIPPTMSIPALAPASKAASLSLYTILHLGILLFCMMQLHGM
ncbi:hypothetical protein Lalb_Chr06g0163321 [Lupinus albus]|uniref:Classical arabinogalactan protein 26-like n=1 Tax=Lupinus albus TaxID=3870 RepID=A0A6A4QC60_LUPAL|nr:hypothetical protein Lalb_Chr06g0163321 [Lupinus albus]